MRALRPAGIQSLRWRLLRTVSIVALMIWTLTGLLSYLQARHEAEEFLDGHLALSARTLMALVRDNEARLPDLKARLDGMRRQSHGIYDPPIEFQVGKADGTPLVRSANAPDIPMRGMAGFMDIQRDGQSWRLYNLAPPEEGYRIQVAQPMELREVAALEVAMQTILPVGAILPVLLLLIYLSIRRGLKPLEDLASEVSARTSENLSALTGRAVPREALPLVTAVNRLMYRLGETLENERRFTADAAHGEDPGPGRAHEPGPSGQGTRPAPIAGRGGPGRPPDGTVAAPGPSRSACHPARSPTRRSGGIGGYRGGRATG